MGIPPCKPKVTCYNTNTLYVRGYLMKKEVQIEIKRFILIIVASFIVSANIKSFVRAGDLFPGGFTGLTILIQRIAGEFLNITLPFSVINLLLNAVPAVISYKTIGKKFTIYACIMIFCTSIFTDIIPVRPLTYDILLVSIFGGIINGVAVSLCLNAGACSGGTDFIAVYVAQKFGIEAWNYILIGNAVMLIIAGFLFGWDRALYSILFQFAATQVVHALNLKYRKHTLFIVSNYPQKIYDEIFQCTHHGATIFNGVGCYEKESRSMIYSVVSSDEVKIVLKKVKAADPEAFINVIKTDQINGRFYTRPTE